MLNSWTRSNCKSREKNCNIIPRILRLHCVLHGKLTRPCTSTLNWYVSVAIWRKSASTSCCSVCWSTYRGRSSSSSSRRDFFFVSCWAMWFRCWTEVAICTSKLVSRCSSSSSSSSSSSTWARNLKRCSSNLWQSLSNRSKSFLKTPSEMWRLGSIT